MTLDELRKEVRLLKKRDYIAYEECKYNAYEECKRLLRESNLDYREGIKVIVEELDM